MYYKLINAHQSMQSSLLAGGGGGGGPSPINRLDGGRRRIGAIGVASAYRHTNSSRSIVEFDR